MFEKTKKQKKGSISEEDVSTVLQKYSATTVLSLLQEVAQVADVKIDWDALVKRTTTGISNAREYQMLWRHLAYREALLDRLDDGSEPLDNNSDLEYELEASPSVSSEVATEAAACVKVLIASGLPRDSSMPNNSTVEAPLTINIPSVPSYGGPSDNSQAAKFMRGKNITIPVSVQKQPLPTPSTEEVDGNGTGTGNLPVKRKRKPWSSTEDMELIAAVKKCGEGNWANILKGDFKGNRTASQLSQRWAIIRKRQDNLNVGSSSQLSETQWATRLAVRAALNMPMSDNLKATSSISGTNSNITQNRSTHPTAAEASSVAAQSQNQSDQDSVLPPTHQSGISRSSSKSRVATKKPSTKSSSGPDARVKAAAVAAGARIATPLDAASLLKAAQAKNAVHIIPTGSSLVKSSVAANGNSIPGHPNVHFIRTGLVSAPLSTYSANPSNASRPNGTQHVPSQPVKHEVATVQLNPSSTPRESHTLSESANCATMTIPVADNVISGSANTPAGIIQEKQVNPASDVLIGANIEDKAASSDNEAKEKVTDDATPFLRSAGKEQVQEAQASISGNSLHVHIKKDEATVLGNSPNEQVYKDQTTIPISEAFAEDNGNVVDSKCSSNADKSGKDQMVSDGNPDITEYGSQNDKSAAAGFPVRNEGDTQSLAGEIDGNQSAKGELDLPSTVLNESNGNLEFPNKAAETKTGEENT